MGILLQKYINGFGYEVEQGYFEVDEIKYRYDYNVFYFAGNIWLSKECKEEGFRPVDRFEDSFELQELPATNLLEFVYNHIIETAAKEDVLTTNPKYKGFIGCTYEK